MYGDVKNTAEWMHDGLCRTSEPELWYSKDKHDQRAAKQVCAKCPVRKDCLDYGLSIRDMHGVWGGLDEKQRKDLRRRSLLSR